MVFFSGPGSKFSLELKICLSLGIVIARGTQTPTMLTHRWRERENKLLRVFKLALAHPGSLPVPRGGFSGVFDCAGRRGSAAQILASWVGYTPGCYREQYTYKICILSLFIFIDCSLAFGMCFVNSRFVEQHRVYSRAETGIQSATPQLMGEVDPQSVG